MRYPKQGILLFIISLFAQVVACQYQNVQNINFRSYSTTDGLSHAFVTTILKDHKGFMWFGTIKGLNRFDGYDFKTFKYSRSDTRSLSNDNILEIKEHKEGLLLISTEIGINLFDTKKELFYRFYHNNTDTTSLFSDMVYCMQRINDSLYYIGTSRGLSFMKVKFNNEVPEIVCYQTDLLKSLNKELNNTGVLSLFLDAEAILWVGTRDHGVFALDLKSKESEHFVFIDFAGVYSNQVYSLFDDKKGNIWVGTVSQLYKLNKRTHDIKAYLDSPTEKSSVPGNLIRCIVPDSKGRMWVGTYNGIGMYRESSDDFQSYRNDKREPKSLSSNYIHTIYNAGDNRLWIGTETGGVSLIDFNNKEFNSIPYNDLDENALSGAVINSIYVDNKKRLWVGTSGAGLDLFTPEKRKLNNFRHNPQDVSTLSGDVVSAIHQDKAGDMWFGTWGFGLNKLPANKYAENDFERPLHIPYNFISDITEDTYGRLWIATSEGPLMKHPEKDTFLLLNYPFDKIKYLGEIGIDSSGYLYFPTLANGLFVLPPVKDYQEQLNPDSAAVIHFKHNKTDTNSLPLHLMSMHTDKTGTVWISTQGSGIIKIEVPGNDITKTNEVTFRRITESDGLCDNVAVKILEDEQDNLWVSTSNGISQYNYKNETCNNFYKEDGLISDQFFWYAGVKDAAGNLYFGTTQGLNYFVPEKIALRKAIPDALISDFMIMNKSVPISNGKEDKQTTISENIAFLPELTLTHRDFIFSFIFSSNTYTLPERTQFAFMLEGFDKEWVYTSSEKRYARYTNLPGGKYVFKVKASNSDGIWNEESTNVKIKVLPPWYKTLLFKILAVLAFLFTIAIIYFMRLARIERQKRLLTAQVKERTLELNNANNELRLQKDEIVNQKQEIEKQAEELYQTNTSLIEANKTKDKLFSIIGHDLKNPLNAVIGINEIMLMQYERMKDERRKYFLTNMQEASYSMLKLLDDLLNWSRSLSGNIKYRPEKLKISTVLDDCISVLHEAAVSKKNKVQLHFNKEETLVCDRNILNTLIRNIVSNAIKFTENGTIDITVSRTDDTVTFVVKDEGVGIPKDEIPTLFHIKTSVSTVGTQGEKGTGLGLLLCREFVDKLNGKIWVKSEEGKGTSFFIQIPDMQLN